MRAGGHVGGSVELEGPVDGGSKGRADGGCLEKGRGSIRRNQILEIRDNSGKWHNLR